MKKAKLIKRFVILQLLSTAKLILSSQCVALKGGTYSKSNFTVRAGREHSEIARTQLLDRLEE